MGGGFVASTQNRVRIKGHTWSCLRFFLIAVSFMMAWVLITSELGYYSRWFGPQILLELSIAFNLPAIPVLLLSGQVEKVLDAQLGPTKSLAIRLMLGLAGCTACAAAFPFLPTTHTSLLWLVAVLGMLSAIAFSTSYQLVQWFRHADIIALGIGGVGTGPLVLLLQLCLEVGPNPERWQWVAMFEVTAGVMLLGLLSAGSLFAQYWKVLTGEEEYQDARQPLLPTSSSSPSQAEDHQEEVSMHMTKMATALAVLPPDPSYCASGMLSPDVYTWPDEDEWGVPQLGRASSFGSGTDAARQHAAKRRRHSLRRLQSASPQTLQHHALEHSLATPSKPGVHAASHSPAYPASLMVIGEPDRTRSEGAHSLYAQAAWHPSMHPEQGYATPAGHMDESGVMHAGQEPTASSRQPSTGAGPGAGGEAAGQEACSSGAHSNEGETGSMTLYQEHVEVMRDAWQVVLAFTISVTVVYVVFPFFTYCQSSGLIGDELPKVLFFGRIFADIIGRFAPRRKALMVTAPASLMAFAFIKAVLCCLFFLYLKAPPRFHHDLLSLGIVLVMWLLGGYINTSANIMAPSLVKPALVGRASALMALVFQVAHFLGLLIAVLLAYLLWGDVVG